MAKESNFVSAVVYVHNNENEIEYFLNAVVKIKIMIKFSL